MSIEYLVMWPALKAVNDAVTTMVQMLPLVPDAQRPALAAQMMNLTEQMQQLIGAARTAGHLRCLCMN